MCMHHFIFFKRAIKCCMVGPELWSCLRSQCGLYNFVHPPLIFFRSERLGKREEERRDSTLKRQLEREVS